MIKINKKYKVVEVKNFFLKYLKCYDKFLNKYYLLRKTNTIHTFFNSNYIDIIGLNDKNHVIYKYEMAPKNIICEIKNPKEKTNILILPKNTSSHIRIGDILSFENKHEF